MSGIILRHAAFIHLRGEFGVQLEVGVSFCRGMRAKGRTNNESEMECGDLSPLWHRRQNESGDKSPHSKRAVIELTKAT